MTVIGLTGYAQHGKDTVGQLLVDEFGFTKFAFADRLRETARGTNPTISLEGSPDEVFRALELAGLNETVNSMTLFPPHYKLQVLLDHIGYELVKKIPDGREFYQRLGTEGVRFNLGEDAWVNAVGATIESAGVENAVLTDTRFPNEGAWVLEHGQLWGVVRQNEDGSEFDNGIGRDHYSEMFIAGLLTQADPVYYSSSVEGLRRLVRSYMTGEDDV